MHQRNVKLVPQVSVTVEFNSPPKLIAEDFCDFEVRFDICSQNFLEISFIRKPVYGKPLLFVEFASRKFEVYDNVWNLTSCLSCCQHSDVAFVDNGIHGHAE